MTDTYTVERQTYRGAVRWSLSKTSDRPGWLGAVVALGHYQTKKQALTTARLLAGWRDRVVTIKGN